MFRGKAAGSAPLTFSANGNCHNRKHERYCVGRYKPRYPVGCNSRSSNADSDPVLLIHPHTKPDFYRGVAQVRTGPGETTILALIVGSIVALLYVGYAGSDAFRRNEAKSYSDEAHKNPPDFRS